VLLYVNVMYAELQMALTLTCFALNNFPTCVYKVVAIDEQNTTRDTLVSMPVPELQVPEIRFRRP
jgi:hypothetical protein